MTRCKQGFALFHTSCYWQERRGVFRDTLRRAGATALQHWWGFPRGLGTLSPLSYCFLWGISTEISAGFVNPRTKFTARTLCLRGKCLTGNVRGGTKMTIHEMAGLRGLRALPQQIQTSACCQETLLFSHDPEKANISQPVETVCEQIGDFWSGWEDGTQQ